MMMKSVRGFDVTLLQQRTQNKKHELLVLLGATHFKSKEGISSLWLKKSIIAKQKRHQKFAVRNYTRCQKCGRPHAVNRKFGVCCLCFRDLAYAKAIPGIVESILIEFICT